MAGQLIDAGRLAVPGRRWWRFSPSGAAGIAVAERDALGTTARVAVWPVRLAGVALTAVDREIERLDRSASRFRADSELSLAHRRGDVPVHVSAGLAEAIQVALAAAGWTGGLVDPTIGASLIALGYDRDFAAITPDEAAPAVTAPGPAPGWQRIRLSGNLLQIPAGVTLDLGATAKGLGADRAAAAAQATSGAGGVLVSLGGDIAVAGTCPAAGWPVLIADDHRQSGRGGGGSPVQQVRLRRGGLATSSIACRQWRRAGRTLHHILDPRTGLPAAGPWRTVSVAAASCAEANAASTAAIITGLDAPRWLQAEGLPARLVRHDGSVVRAGGWPEGEDGPLVAPAARMPGPSAAIPAPAGGRRLVEQS